jgi:hypothetical protein
VAEASCQFGNTKERVHPPLESATRRLVKNTTVYSSMCVIVNC